MSHKLLGVGAGCAGRREPAQPRTPSLVPTPAPPRWSPHLPAPAPGRGTPGAPCYEGPWRWGWGLGNTWGPRAVLSSRSPPQPQPLLCPHPPHPAPWAGPALRDSVAFPQLLCLRELGRGAPHTTPGHDVRTPALRSREARRSSRQDCGQGPWWPPGRLRSRGWRMGPQQPQKCAVLVTNRVPGLAPGSLPCQRRTLWPLWVEPGGPGGTGNRLWLHRAL